MENKNYRLLSSEVGYFAGLEKPLAAYVLEGDHVAFQKAVHSLRVEFAAKGEYPTELSLYRLIEACKETHREKWLFEAMPKILDELAADDDYNAIIIIATNPKLCGQLNDAAKLSLSRIDGCWERAVESMAKNSNTDSKNHHVEDFTETLSDGVVISFEHDALWFTIPCGRKYKVLQA